MKAKALVFGLLVSCAQAAPKPEAQPTVDPRTVFPEAIQAIEKGDVDALLALRDEPREGKLGTFLRELYARYGPVQRVATLAFEQEAGVSRGVFLAEHKNGPFVWDMIFDGQGYPLLKGSSDLSPYLVAARPPAEVMGLANASIAALNKGDAAAVFKHLVCNCLAATVFAGQVDTLRRLGGEERARTFAGGETLPGLSDQIFFVHFLSERTEVKLGFHFVFWKVNGEWEINAVNWAQDELLPPPRSIDLSRR